MLLGLVLVPLAGGLTAWSLGDRRRLAGAAVALGALVGTLGLAVVAAVVEPVQTLRWGPHLALRLEVHPIAVLPLVLVPAVALPVVGYALGYGAARGRARMVGGLVAFTGAMALLLVAGDLLTLLVAWELVGAASWGLILHHWRGEAPSKAAHAFLVTRVGDLGLVVAAGVAVAELGTLRLSALDALSAQGTAVLAAGVLAAAFTKSAQLPASPWLFSAMAGPAPVSALLHSATMVAAGVYLLARLHPVLDTVGWAGPLTIGVGLATALAGGVVSALHHETKPLLAASTAAHHGLMLVAVGAGFPTVAIAHLVAHGAFKSLLFVSAGVASESAGTEDLARLRLGRRLPVVAILTAVGAAALAGVPPLGGAWTKEQVVAAASHASPWLGGATIGAGALSAYAAARFLGAGYGPGVGEGGPVEGRGARLALAVLATASIGLGVLWLPGAPSALEGITGGSLPASAPWEMPATLASVGLAVVIAALAARRGRLAAPVGAAAWVEWFGLPALARHVVVDPTLALARRASRFDDRVLAWPVRAVRHARAPRALAGLDDRVLAWPTRAGTRRAGALARVDDRGVAAAMRAAGRAGTWVAGLLGTRSERGVDAALRDAAAGVGAAGRRARRLQTGLVQHAFVGIAAVVVLLVGLVAVWG